MSDDDNDCRVRLISHTMPTNSLQEQGIDDASDLIAFCARVSNPANQYNTETADRLIQYLIQHKHWSPLEMVNVCLEIETTRDISRQILRHRSFSFQEFSQRYADPVCDMQSISFTTREARLQDNKNRQNSIETSDDELKMEWEKRQLEVIEKAREVYTWAISNGIAREQARCVLPEGNTMTRMYMNGCLRSWIHYLELRCGNGTQKEHMMVAKKCAQIIARVFPSSTYVGADR